ncbi:hypothetical protein [Desulfohalovibrio reitneri]|uniref:hypothetical protein n=1 Tax=Desulfohalovibrio reitneri TaxID=1307759 RepID=UPI0004A6FC1E|nr:hypothetical protein [Desulfohalovibrio reitneri]
MDPTQLVAIISSLAQVVETLGAWGVVGLVLAFPLTAVALFTWHAWRQDKILNAIRRDHAESLRAQSQETRAVLEAYRKDSIAWADEERKRVECFLQQHKEVSQFYRDNVELVRSWEGLAKDQREVLLLVSQTMQKVADKIDSNLFCPIVKREQGK